MCNCNFFNCRNEMRKQAASVEEMMQRIEKWECNGRLQLQYHFSTQHKHQTTFLLYNIILGIVVVVVLLSKKKKNGGSNSIRGESSQESGREQKEDGSPQSPPPLSSSSQIPFSQILTGK